MSLRPCQAEPCPCPGRGGEPDKLRPACVPEPAAAPSHRLPRTIRARLEEEEKHIYLFYFKIIILKTKTSL